MSAPVPDQFPPMHPAVESAQHAFAHEIHADLERGLDLLPGISDEAGRTLAENQERYSQILFGELAMSLANVTLPAEASPVDRARGIAEALRRIVQTPNLFEKVVGAPYSAELAAILAPAPANTAADDTEQAAALELRAKVTEKGYFDRSMLSVGQSVRLDYQAAPNHKKRRFGPSIEPGQPIALKLVAAEDLTWDVKLFGYRHTDSQSIKYTDHLGNRTETLGDIYTVAAVESAQKLPGKLSKLTGQPVKFGPLTPGAQLHIEHGHGIGDEELRGDPGSPYSRMMSLPVNLQQAYFGPSNQYPLFKTTY